MYKNEKIWAECARRAKQDFIKERRYRREVEGLGREELEDWCKTKDMKRSDKYDEIAHEILEEILDDYDIYTNKILEEKRKALGECGKKS